MSDDTMSEHLEYASINSDKYIKISYYSDYVASISHQYEYENFFSHHHNYSEKDLKIYNFFKSIEYDVYLQQPARFDYQCRLIKYGHSEKDNELVNISMKYEECRSSIGNGAYFILDIGKFNMAKFKIMFT